MSQKRVQKTRAGTAETTEESPPPEVPDHPEADALVTHSDELLDEIDGLLEENAAEFVASYIQKGGE